jgi:hypothetical protein
VSIAAGQPTKQSQLPPQVTRKQSFSLPASVLDQLRKDAAREGLNLSEYVRLAVAERHSRMNGTGKRRN